MWWRNAHPILITLCLALAGCGFHPLYGSQSVSPANAQVRERLALVKVTPIDDRNGQILHNELQSRLHSETTPVPPEYQLTITLISTLGGINFQKNATASGGELTMSATWSLTRIGAPKSLASGTFSSVDSVNFLGPRYASVSAEHDAEHRAINDLADMITDRVSVYLSSHKQ